MIKIIDEESYLAIHDCGMGNMGDAHLHHNIPDTINKQKNIKRMCKDNHDLIIKRAALRNKYQEEVESGKIRPPTGLEETTQISKGHSDNRATKAAKRLLQRLERRKLWKNNVGKW